MLSFCQSALTIALRQLLKICGISTWLCTPSNEKPFPKMICVARIQWNGWQSHWLPNIHSLWSEQPKFSPFIMQVFQTMPPQNYTSWIYYVQFTSFRSFQLCRSLCLSGVLWCFSLSLCVCDLVGFVTLLEFCCFFFFYYYSTSSFFFFFSTATCILMPMFNYMNKTAPCSLCLTHK